MSEDGGYMDGYNDGLIDGREAKPLRWRTGPVPMSLAPGDEVFYEAFMDGVGIWHGVGLGTGDGKITMDMDNDERVVIDHENCRWLPLSEILDLIGE